MRKFILVTLLLLTSIGLVACGNGEEKANEIYTKAYEVAKNMKSAEMTIDMNQQITIGDSSMDTTTKMEGKVIADPIALHQKGTISMDLGEMPLEMETEMYMADDEFYMYESMTDQWLKLDNSMMELYNQQQELADQMGMFEDYVNEFNLKELEDAYQLQLTIDNKAIEEIMDTIVADYMPEDVLNNLGEEGKKLLESMEVNHLYYELLIDKKTYETKEYQMEIESTMDVEGEEMGILIDMNGIYDNINGVESIEIPEEVKEQAFEQGL